MARSHLNSLFRFGMITATALLAAATIAAAFSGNVAPADSLLMPLLGLALPVLLIANLVVAICWALTSRRRWALMPLVAILCNWGYLASVLQFNPAHEKAAGGKYLKLATYNVGNFGNEITGYSCREIARFMEEQEVDVLCFQEFGGNNEFTVDSLCNVFRHHWRYRLLPQQTAGSAHASLPLAIFSRYPLVNARFIPYPNSANCSLMCHVVVAGDTIRLLNNHLQTTSINQKRRKWQRELATDNTRREVQAAKDAANTLHGNFLQRTQQTHILGKFIRTSPYPVLVCGDFNSIPSSYTYHYLRTLLQDGFRTAGSGYMYTYRYARRLFRIDYIFHSPSLEGISYTSPDLDLCSDHNPVLMEVKLTPGKDK